MKWTSEENEDNRFNIMLLTFEEIEDFAIKYLHKSVCTHGSPTSITDITYKIIELTHIIEYDSLSFIEHEMESDSNSTIFHQIS